MSAPTVSENKRHITVDVEGRRVGVADVERLERPGVVRASLHVESGLLPRGSRRLLVDAVLASPEVQSGRRLEAAIPLGDGEMLQRLRERCGDVRTRAAGSSVLVDLVLPEQPSGTDD